MKLFLANVVDCSKRTTTATCQQHGLPKSQSNGWKIKRWNKMITSGAMRMQFLMEDSQPLMNSILFLSHKFFSSCPFLFFKSRSVHHTQNLFISSYESTFLFHLQLVCLLRGKKKKKTACKYHCRLWFIASKSN